MATTSSTNWWRRWRSIPMRCWRRSSSPRPIRSTWSRPTVSSRTMPNSPTRSATRPRRNEDWDPSIAGAGRGFPTVVRRMAEDLDWTEQLGDAMLAQTDDVLDAVQRQRARAVATGNLTSNEAQVVDDEGDTISHRASRSRRGLCAELRRRQPPTPRRRPRRAGGRQPPTGTPPAERSLPPARSPSAARCSSTRSSTITTMGRLLARADATSTGTTATVYPRPRRERRTATSTSTWTGTASEPDGSAKPTRSATSTAQTVQRPERRRGNHRPIAATRPATRSRRARPGRRAVATRGGSRRPSWRRGRAGGRLGDARAKLQAAKQQARGLRQARHRIRVAGQEFGAASRAAAAPRRRRPRRRAATAASPSRNCRPPRRSRRQPPRTEPSRSPRRSRAPAVETGQAPGKAVEEIDRLQEDRPAAARRRPRPSAAVRAAATRKRKH